MSTSTSHHRSRFARPLTALAVAAVVLMAGGRATWAQWHSGQTLPATKISSGGVDLKLDGADNSAFTALSISGMVPGDSTAGVITVKNSGASPLTYTVDAAATNPDGKNLAGVLVVKVSSAAAVTGTGHARTCGGSAIAGSKTSFVTGLVPTARTLAAGAQETLCVQAVLPNAAPVSTTTTYQSASTSVTLAFHASQVIS